MGELEGRDPSQMRISDADRHQVAEVLRQAAGEGRLELDELDERLEATWSAKTYGDLVPITADLPVRQADGALPDAIGTTERAVEGAGPRHTNSLAIMSGQDRKGVWVVDAQHNAFSLMGGITLDLREAVFTSREVVINANTVMGGIDIVVNARTKVSVEGVGIMGAFEEGRARVPARTDTSSPLVRVRGLALMGGVTVVRKQMPGEPKPPRRLPWASPRDQLPPHLGH